MLLDLVKTSWKILIFVALVSLSITWAFNIENTLITSQTINGINIKTFNIQSYLQNINNAWQTTALNFEDILPPVTWKNITTGILEEQFWKDLVNNLAFIADWAYFPINFILWLWRWGVWLINILLAIIGWNTQTNANGEYYSQLVRINTWIIQNLMIPYINPN